MACISMMANKEMESHHNQDSMTKDLIKIWSYYIQYVYI